MAFVWTAIIAGAALLLISTVSQIVLGSWLTDITAWLGAWEMAVCGSHLLSQLLSWLVAVSLFIAAIKFLSKGKS